MIKFWRAEQRRGDNEGERYCCCYSQWQRGCEQSWKDGVPRFSRHQTAPRGSPRLSSSLPAGVHGRLSLPLSLPSWFLALITKYREWQAGRSWDSYLELPHSSFLKKKVWEKEKIAQKLTQVFHQLFPLNNFPLVPFFFFYYSFWVYSVFHMPSITLLLWSSNTKVSYHFPKKTYWWKFWRFKFSA